MWRTTKENFAGMLQRLDGLIDAHEPEFAGSLNPPATDADIEELKAAIEPYDLPVEVEMVYRWHNGQNEDGRLWWPPLDHGVLLGTKAAAAHRASLNEICEEPFQWSDAWLSITHSSWSQVAVQLSEPLKGLVINASFPDPPSVLADDLTAVIQAQCILLEGDLPLLLDEPFPRDRKATRRRNARLTPTRLLPFLSWRGPLELEDLAES